MVKSLKFLKINIFQIDRINYGECEVVKSLKIIGYGASFIFPFVNGVSNVIPDYMPPEII